LIFSLMIPIISYASENNKVPLKEKYTEEELDYFYKIALSLEYGNQDNIIHKWDNSEIKVSIVGSPTEEHISELNKVISELNDLIGSIKFKIVNKNGDLKIHFINHNDFYAYISDKNIAESSAGYVYIWWNKNNKIYRGNIFIAIDIGDTESQSHAIREELTQSLGLLNDDYKYKNSMFYQGWVNTQEYSDIDKSLIKIKKLFE
jgi:hypothetical protein